MAQFEGVWGTFPHLDEAAFVIKAMRKEGKKCGALSPCPRYELDQALGNPQSKIPFIALVGGMLGIFFGYGLPTWTSLDWVLPVSQKPIVSIPAFSVIGFELMVLIGGLSTAVGIFLLGFLEIKKSPLPKSTAFTSYQRFSLDRFGVTVECEKKDAPKIEALMKRHFAEEVVHEF